MQIKILMVLLTSLLVGCASGPTKEQLANADYGIPISQENAEEKVKSFFFTYLKDPSSAQYIFQDVTTRYITKAPISGGDVLFGHGFIFHINSKNSYGAYIGYEQMQALFQDGTLVYIVGRKYMGGRHDWPYQGNLLTR